MKADPLSSTLFKSSFEFLILFQVKRTIWRNHKHIKILLIARCQKFIAWSSREWHPKCLMKVTMHLKPHVIAKQIQKYKEPGSMTQHATGPVSDGGVWTSLLALLNYYYTVMHSATIEYNTNTLISREVSYKKPVNCGPKQTKHC